MGMLGSVRPTALPDSTTAIEADGVPGPVLAVAVDALRAGPGARRHSIWAMAVSAILATAAHVGVLVAMTWPAHQRLNGAGGLDLDAISIEVSLVASSVMESRQAAVVATGSMAPAEVALNDGMPVAVAAGANAVPPTDSPALRDRPTAQPAPETAQLDAAVQLDRRPEAPMADKAQEVQPADAERSTEHAKPEASTAMVAVPEGGAAAVAVDQQRASEGEAAASPGVVQSYAKSVVEALSKNRPKGVQAGARGVVKIAFAIDDDGALAFARVAKSSGVDKLDNAALDAVRRIKLPPPPTGMSAAQRTYEIPYNFR